MELQGSAKLLRIFIGESDKLGHSPLHEIIISSARDAGLAGASSWKGIMGFGKSSRHIHSSKILDLGGDLPIVIEIADEESKINAFLPELKSLFEKSGSGGLVTLETVQVIHYLKEQNKDS